MSMSLRLWPGQPKAIDRGLGELAESARLLLSLAHGGVGGGHGRGMAARVSKLRLCGKQGASRRRRLPLYFW